MTDAEVTARPYGGASAPQRRADRRARLVDAALELVLEDGVAALTVGGVCARAGVAKRYFYESFTTLDDLAGQTLTDALEVVGTRMAHVGASVGERLHGGDARVAGSDARAGLTELVEGTVRAVLSVFDDPRVARLYVEASASPGVLDAREAATSRFVAQLLQLVTGRDDADPEAQLVARLLVAGTTDVVSAWLRGDIDLDAEAVVRALTRLGTDAAHIILGG